MRDIRRIGKLGKENILPALHQLSADLHRTADGRLPERHVKNVMQAKWNQRPLHHTKNQRTEISGAGHQTSDCIDSVLYCRPDKIHHNSDKQVDKRRNNRHKPRSTEKGKCIRQPDLVKTVVQCCSAKPDENTAKHTHLQCLDPTDGRNRSVQYFSCNASILQNHSV